MMEWYERVVLDSGRSAALWGLLGFLVTFTVTRAVTRRIRAKQVAGPAADGGGGGLADVYIAGVHVHHQGWGILLVLLAGLVEFRYDPGHRGPRGGGRLRDRVVVPIVATIGAVRPARPNSVWARRRYSARTLGRSRRRFGARYERRHDRLRDLIGGAPDPAESPRG